MYQPYNQPYPPPYGYAPVPPPYTLEPYKRPLRRWANIIGGGILMVQLVMMGVSILLYNIFELVDYSSLSPRMIDLVDQMIQLACYVIGFWLPTMFMVAMIKIPASVAFPLRKPRASHVAAAVCICLGASMIGSLLSGMLSILFQSVFGVTPIMPDMSAPQGIPANIVYVVSMTVMPGIFEEAMFRGVIMQSLRRFGDGFALIVSAILFGLCHGNLIQGPNAFVLGIVIGYFVLRTGSLLTGVVIHFVNNGLAVLFDYLMQMMTDQQAELLNTLVFVGYILLGLLGLVYMIMRGGNNLFRVPASDYPLPTSKKYTTFFCAAAVVVMVIFMVVLTAFYFE